jgi:hypothetical protein
MKLRMILNALLLFAVALVWAAPLDTSQLAPSVYYGPDGTIAVTEGKLYTVDSSGNPTALTASATEMNYIDGVTPGTLAASKAVIVNSSKKINEWDPTSLKINGTAITPTAAQINLLLQGTAAGKKIASGTADITSSATIAAGTHGLATVTGVWASLSDPPSLTGNDVATTVSGTSIIIYVYKPTASGDCTPIEATDPRAVQWFAIGT